MTQTAAELTGEQTDAARDVIAAVRAVHGGDSQGLTAIVNGASQPRIAFGLAAVVINHLLGMARPPLSTEDVNRLLADLSSWLTNGALDRFMESRAQEGVMPNGD